MGQKWEHWIKMTWKVGTGLCSHHTWQFSFPSWNRKSQEMNVRVSEGRVVEQFLKKYVEKRGFVHCPSQMSKWPSPGVSYRPGPATSHATRAQTNTRMRDTPQRQSTLWHLVPSSLVTQRTTLSVKHAAHVPSVGIPLESCFPEAAFIYSPQSLTEKVLKVPLLKLGLPLCAVWSRSEVRDSTLKAVCWTLHPKGMLCLQDLLAAKVLWRDKCYSFVNISKYILTFIQLFMNLTLEFKF